MSFPPRLVGLEGQNYEDHSKFAHCYCYGMRKKQTYIQLICCMMYRLEGMFSIKDT